MKKTPSLGKSLISTYSIVFFWGGGGWERKWGGVGVGAYLSLTGRRGGLGVGAYSRLGAYQLFLSVGWALIRGGRYSRLGSYSNKYG